ncbi:hypothetical protein Ddye_016029 [Dipteronia dyeriana]|uniref:DUF1985 domain-containing protein n=1 Tax=Dipteronia dyeriana TaxID=168575 RepID=A0AAD9X035_9ROSI|nr:hypothetical protein Ddye_016029 [Dipteronia dyeriana]
MLGNHSVRFLKVKFGLITGLWFGVVPDTSVYSEVENDIHHRYFPEAGEVSFMEMRVVLTLKEFYEAYDAVKLCLINMLIGVDERFKISVWQFQLVEDLDEFVVFPWEEDMLQILPPVPDQTTFGWNSGIEGRGFRDKASNSEGSELEARGFRSNDNEGYELEPQ